MSGWSAWTAAHARVEGNELKLSGLYYDEKTGKYTKGSLCADTGHAAHAGEKLAKELMRLI